MFSLLRNLTIALVVLSGLAVIPAQAQDYDLVVANDGATEHELSWALASSTSSASGEVVRRSGLPDEAFSVVAAATGSTSSPAGAVGGVQDEKWQFDLVIYGWLAGLDGSVATPSGLGVSINKSFSDVLKELDFAFELYHEGRKGQWGYQIDFTYMDLDSKTPGVTGDIDVGIKAILGEVDLTFSPREVPSLQFLAGARVFNVEQTVTLPIGPTEEGDETIVDPVFGAQGTWDLSKHWRFRLHGDIGGFGAGSELTYQALGAFAWEFAHNWRLDFGYRLLGYDIKKGGVNMDTQIHGALLGIGYAF